MWFIVVLCLGLSEPSKTKKGTLITKTSAWTQAVRNRMRQKAGEIQAFRAFDRGEEKWRREHTQRNETDPTSEEGRNLLEDTDRWCDQAYRLKEWYESRKRERIHETDHSYTTRKGPSPWQLPTRRTGTSERENTEGNWENGWKECRYAPKTKEECFRQLLTASPRMNDPDSQNHER